MEKQIEQFGVQAWSQGELYPAVIMVCEDYDSHPSHSYAQAMRAARGYADHDVLMAAMPLEARLRSRSFVLILDGQREEYSSYSDAHEVAKALLESPFLRAQWQQGREFDTPDASYAAEIAEATRTGGNSL